MIRDLFIVFLFTAASGFSQIQPRSLWGTDASLCLNFAEGPTANNIPRDWSVNKIGAYGTLNAGSTPSWSPTQGPNGAAAWSGGGNLDEIAIGSTMPAAVQPGTGPFTLSVWVKTSTSFLGFGGPWLFSWYGGNNTAGIILDSLHSTSSASVTGMEYFVRDINSQNIAVSDYHLLNDGIWHNYVLVRDSQTTIRCYFDGSFVGAGTNASLTTISGNSIYAQNSCFNNYVISGGASARGYYFNCEMWMRALSGAEIRLLYENGRIGQ